jgi:predicted nuclease of predicted toxin-antitoxin system
MRSALFWDITQRIVVNLDRRFGNYRSYLQGSNPKLVSLTLEVETDKLSQNVGNELKRCVISQKSSNLILIWAVLVQYDPELNLISQF